MYIIMCMCVFSAVDVLIMLIPRDMLCFSNHNNDYHYCPLGVHYICVAVVT